MSTPSGLLSLGFMVTCPIFVIFLYVCIWDFDSSLKETAYALTSYGIPEFFLQYTPWPTLRASIGYTGWLVFQAFLFSVLPGKTVTAPPTPGGNTLVYRINGLNSWVLTTITAVVLAVTEILPLSSIAENWGGLVIAANVYGILATLFGWIKGHLFPSATKDRRFSGMYLFSKQEFRLTRFSGSSFHDLLSGIELNPRLGSNWDIKLYQVGRVGMNSWVLM